jgi:hypothetical protein
MDEPAQRMPGGDPADGRALISKGRVTESNRPTGAMHLYAHTAVAIDLSKSWSIFAGMQVPLTERRDVEWAAQAGAEVRFRPAAR